MISRAVPCGCCRSPATVWWPPRAGKSTLSNGKTYAASNYQINSVALSNNGSIAALAEVIYDQYKLPIDYYVTIDMQALVEMVDNFGGIEVYIPHDMSFAGSALKQGYRNLDGASAEFFVRCRHGEGYSNSDIDRLNMQRYFYAGLFKRVRNMGITDVLNQLPLVFNNYIHTDMDLTTIAKMLVSFTRIDSGNIMLAQTPVFSWACPTWARPTALTATPAWRRTRDPLQSCSTPISATTPARWTPAS